MLGVTTSTTQFKKRHTMKTHPSANVYVALLLVSSLFLSSCATSGPQKSAGPNEARITGQESTIWKSVAVWIAPAGSNPNQTTPWKSEMIIPAGRTRLAIRYTTGGLGLVEVLVAEGIAQAKTRELEFDAEPGHEYYAEYTGVSIFDSGFRIIDKTTGKIVADTKTQSDKSK